MNESLFPAGAYPSPPHPSLKMSQQEEERLPQPDHKDASSSGAGFALARLALVSMLRDIETSAHMLRVGQIAGLVAWYATRDAGYAELVCRAAPFHDIGKICIPDAVLHKKGPLDEGEWMTMKRHPEIGAMLLRCPGDALSRVAAEIALGHHEKYDGSGYPQGLSGKNIPLSARIAAVADYFDALATDRCYRPAWPLFRIVESLEKLAGIGFDPDLVSILLERQGEIAALSGQVNAQWALASAQDLTLGDFAPLMRYA